MVLKHFETCYSSLFLHTHTVVIEMDGWNGMEWNGMEWNGMEWNGMEWMDNKPMDG